MSYVLLGKLYISLCLKTSFTFFAPQKEKNFVWKLNLNCELSFCRFFPSVVFRRCFSSFPIFVGLVFFSKIETGNVPRLKIQISNYIYSAFTWMKMLPLPIYSMDYVHTLTHASHFSCIFFYILVSFIVVAVVDIYILLFCCPFFAVKYKSILDEDEQQPKKNTRSNSRGDFFFFSDENCFFHSFIFSY